MRIGKEPMIKANATYRICHQSPPGLGLSSWNFGVKLRRIRGPARQLFGAPVSTVHNVFFDDHLRERNAINKLSSPPDNPMA